LNPHSPADDPTRGKSAAPAGRPEAEAAAPNGGRAIVAPPTLIGSPRPSLSYLAISYLLVFPIFRWLLRGRTAGNANVPPQGALVVVANHGSHLDPPLLGHALGRPVAFMAKEELFRVPLLGPIIRACGAYPVARGAGDREAIRVACQRLAQGWATGVFLDGTRQRNGRVNAPLHGAALLAARCGVPLLPVAILNSHRALGPEQSRLRPVPVHIRIGEPIPPPASRRREDLESTTRACQEAINRLIDEGLIAPRGRLAAARGQAALPPRP
jgi:1-acyl-sn-glycerol-3-phosphate acyltransferase